MPAGKIVDHFMFRREDKAFQVPVRMHKTSEHHDGPGSSRFAGPQQTSSVIFGVEFDSPKICLWSTDIEALRSAVMDALADHYEIAWEEWWIVMVGDGYISSVDGGEALELSWYECMIGKTPDGEIVHTIPRHGGGQDIRKGWPETSTKRTRRCQGSTSLVRATDENTKALEGFAIRLKQLRDRMMEFLHPDKIQANLSQLSGLIAPQLPAPNAEPVEVEAHVVHTPVVSEKSPKRKQKKGQKPLPTPKKPKIMRKCKQGKRAG